MAIRARKSTDELAEVVPFPRTNSKSCFNCVNAQFPEGEYTGVYTWCTVFNEEIIDEFGSVIGCEAYQRGES